MSKASQTYKVAPCLQHKVSARWSHDEVRHGIVLKFVVPYLPQVAPRANVTFSISAEVVKMLIVTFPGLWKRLTNQSLYYAIG